MTKLTSVDSRMLKRWKGPLERKRMGTVAIGLVLVFGFSVIWAMRRQGKKHSPGQSGSCHFAAVFNFGDSNSDTGGMSAAIARRLPPYGQTFFGKPSGRFSDGRLIIDFLAERLGLPYLGAYLDSVGSNFRHGANFAASGSTIRLTPGLNLVHLNRQVSQFEQFKSRSMDLYNQAQSSCVKMRLPTPDDFANALYTLDTGQNDIFHGLTSNTEEQVQSSIPGIIDEFGLALERLYLQGARAFWIHNTGPIGCLAYFNVNPPPKPGNPDKVGCLKSYNDVAQQFNKQLKDRVSQLRTSFQDASFIYIDIYSAKYSLISEAKEHGFVDPLGYCCGHSEGYHLECGERPLVNGTEVYGAPCNNPSEYISWDKIHYTEAANHWLANRILDGSLSDPPQIPVTRACHKSLH